MQHLHWPLRSMKLWEVGCKVLCSGSGPPTHTIFTCTPAPHLMCDSSFAEEVVWWSDLTYIHVLRHGHRLPIDPVLLCPSRLQCQLSSLMQTPAQHSHAHTSGQCTTARNIPAHDSGDFTSMYFPWPTESASTACLLWPGQQCSDRKITDYLMNRVIHKKE